MRKPTPQEKHKLERRILKDSNRRDIEREESIIRAIRSIPKGKVATYGQVAAAAGYPLYHRLVARILNRVGTSLPWQRVVGAGGAIKLHLDAGLEQRMRLEMEGVTFRGRRVAMDLHQHVFDLWRER